MFVYVCDKLISFLSSLLRSLSVLFRRVITTIVFAMKTITIENEACLAIDGRNADENLDNLRTKLILEFLLFL